jgi:serine phosphatase RsbU (regulator of sigma subunit)
VQQALPLAVLVTVAAVDVLLLGRERQLLSLVVMSPLLAATALSRRATLGYGFLALVVAALLGIYDGQYDPVDLTAQLFRLAGVALGTVAAVAACTLRLRQEAELARLIAQEATSRAVVQLAEELQRSLLSDVPHVPGLETAVRYQPAARHAEVGGDWYDVFPLRDGSTVFVIGDVAGHDVPAATTMAQARGMLRGIAQTLGGSPAAMLAALDRAFATLAMATPVTAVVAALEPRGTGPPEPPCLYWSNAGHPPPVLIRADLTARLLERPVERLLGVTPDAPRSDHEIPLRPGDTLLFYTDGLIERRDISLDEGLEWLLAHARRLAAEPLDRFCDGLLAELPGRVEDDVALLAVRLSAEPRACDLR